MVKTVALFLFALCLSITGFSQASIYKTWIGEKQEYLEITEKISRLDIVNHDYENNDYKTTNNGSTLNFIRIPRDYQKREEPVVFHFKIIKLTEDTLILAGLDSPTRFELYNKPEYLFINKSALIDKNLTFQKLEFTSDICFGHCPQMKVAIDSAGKMHFLGGRDAKKKSKKIQTGQLTQKQLNKLIQILKESCLEKFPEELHFMLDAPEYDFLIYYNGNKKIKSSGTEIPYASSALQNYLLNIYLQVNLSELKIDDGFKWESPMYMDFN